MCFATYDVFVFVCMCCLLRKSFMVRRVCVCVGCLCCALRKLRCVMCVNVFVVGVVHGKNGFVVCVVR